LILKEKRAKIYDGIKTIMQNKGIIGKNNGA
jgi:hypothetical protein